MLNIAAYEVNRSIQKSSSLDSQTKDHPTRSQSREHEGLMTWPDRYFKRTQPQEHPIAEINEHANNLSVRELQLGMYGSMVSRIVL